MRARYRSIAGIILGLASLSAYSPPRYAGLLTDDYGILSLADFDEDGQLEPARGFPEEGFVHYWLCLEPEHYFLNCEATGRMEPEGIDLGASTFWIHSRGHLYDLGTRRNRDIGACEDMTSDIKKLMTDEPVVCLYASYLDSTDEKSDWIIDRVKTRKGQWSWFARPEETPTGD